MQLADHGIQIYTTLLSVFAHHVSIDGQCDVGVIDTYLSVNVVGAVESVDVDILIVVAVVFKLVDDTIGLDSSAAFATQVADDVYGGS